MKRILAVLSAFLISVSCIPRGVQAAAEYVQVNNVVNGRFESLLFGAPRAWTLYGGSIGDGFYAEDGALKMAPEENTPLIAYQKVEGICGGGTYTVSFRLRAVSQNTKGAAVKIECAGNSSGDVEKKYGSISPGSWQDCSFSFTAPADVTAVSVLLRLYDGGEVYWDDVAVTGLFAADKNVNVIPAPQPAELAPMAADGKELLQNTGFEKGKTGWGASDSWKGERVELSAETPYAGETCVYIATNSSDKPHIYRTVSVEECTEYQFSVWYKTTGTQFAVKLEFGTGSGSVPGYTETKLPYAVPGREGQWVQFAYTFTTPKGAKRVTVCPRLYGVGEVYVDDISLYKTVQDRLLLETDRIFYYSDRTENGVATARFNTQHYSDMASYKVKFELADNCVTMPMAEECTYSFPMTRLAEKKKEYTLTAYLIDGKGNVAEQQSQVISKWDRPTRLTKDGRYVINGQEITPVLAYDVPVEKYPEMKKAGINMVRVGLSTDITYTKSVLDAAEKNGLLVLACMYANMRPTAHPDNYNNYEKILQAVTGHPALGAYVMLDEPQANWSDLDALFRASYRLIRENDPDVPVLLVEAPALWQAYGNTAKYCDILAVDPYTSVPADVLSYTKTHIDLAYEATGYTMPIVALYRTYGTVGAAQNAFPSIDELRYQIYNGMFHGLQGFGYYKVESAYNNTGLLTETDLWQDMITFNGTEYEDAAAAFFRGEYPIYSDSVTDAYRAKSFVKDGKIHMVVLSRSTAEQQVTIPLASGDGSLSVEGFTATATGGPAAAVSGSGSLSYTLPGLSAVRFVITPENTMDFSALSPETFVDLEGYGWAREQIEDITASGYMTGKTWQSFAPRAQMTKGEGAALLQKITGSTVTADQPQEALDYTTWKTMCTTAATAAGIQSGGMKWDGGVLAERDISETLQTAQNTEGTTYVSRAAAAYTADRLLQWKNAAWRLLGPMETEFSVAGKPVTSLPDGSSTLQITARICREVTEGTAAVMVCRYKGDELLSLLRLPVPQTGGEYDMVTASVPADKGETVKVFLWSDTPLLPRDSAAWIK